MRFWTLPRIWKIRRTFHVLCLLIGAYILYLLTQNMRIVKQRNRTGSNRMQLFHLTSNTLNDGEEYNGVRGFLNCHTWALACETGLRKFAQNPLLPSSPNSQTFVDDLVISWPEENSKGVKTFGRRIFGYLVAPSTGTYAFSLTADCDSEIWLSRDKETDNIMLILESDSQNRSNLSSYSSKLHLKKNHYYYIEVLLMQSQSSSFNLQWRTPIGQNFEPITRDHFFSYMAISQKFGVLIQTVPFSKPTQSFINTHQSHSILSGTEKLMTTAEHLEWKDVKSSLPLCDYKPGYVGKRVLHQYHAVEDFVNPSYVYPQVVHPKLSEGKWNPWFPLDEKEAIEFVGRFMERLDKAYARRYKLKKILNVERKPDWHNSNPVFYKGDLKNGDRFFLELLLLDNARHKELVFSEYVYQHKKDASLCFPAGMQWNRTAPVYLLISARKQTAWLWHFIQNVGRIYKETKDENLHVVVYDYNSSDIDIEEQFRLTSFQNFVVLKNPDARYSRTFSLNRAAEVVNDPNAIVFTLDLHLEIPALFANSVRKHCISGKMVYTPILTRLACGASPLYPSGSWDPWGYGMFGAYKEDWLQFNGFDEVKFQTRWGGEDWDLVNRAYKSGLEFERIKLADFYHYDHSKVGLWT